MVRNRDLRVFSLFVCFLMLWGLSAVGEDTYTSGKRTRTMLVINSYDESEPWANDITEPIANYIAGIDGVSCDIVNLNCPVMTDSVAYKEMADNLFNAYASRPPSYIVMIGAFAFTLRDRIKQEWGDRPILLVTFYDTFGTLDEQYTNTRSLMRVGSGTPLSEVRKDYNFTAVVVPNYCEETVDLMLRMIPDMKEFVFFSTNIYATRYTAAVIKDKLAKEHPEIEFRLVIASEANSEVLRDYISERRPYTGLLLSSWVYEKISLRGNPMLTSNDLRLVMSSKNPVFSLREPYRIFGSIGGVYEDPNEVHSNVRDVLNMMMDSLEMRTVPFVYTKQHHAHINYRLMEEYGIKESACPEDTVFYVKPLTFWEQYLWQTIVVGLIVFIVLCFSWWKMASQMNRIKRLNYNKLFLNNMPVPFAKADIQFNKNGEVTNINYTSKNAAFAQIIEQNAIPGTPFLLFPAEFISEKISQMIEKRQNVVFTYFFEKTNTYYEFTLCSVNEKKDRYGSLTLVDIFATDLTNRYWMEKRLRHFASKLDMALTAARMVAWQWDFRRGIITFDDRGQFERTKSHKVSNYDFDEWEIADNDFLERLHPDDRQKHLDNYAAIMSGRTDKYNLQIRFMSKDKQSFEWVDISGDVTEYDEHGHPTISTGALHIITEKVNADHILLEALEKAKETDRLKSAFLQNMSHEIRTPLNAIIGFSNLLAETDDAAERMEFRDIINLNNDVLLSLVNDILDFAKIEADTIEVNIAPSDINTILQAAEQIVHFRLQPGVQIYVHLGMDACFVQSDPTRLTQVLTNLLTNACKFTAQGQIDLGYELRNDGKTLYFYVKDTGLGISPDKQEAIFEQFVKLNEYIQGTGLGLAICSRLVQLMGGEIGVESEGEGKGSTFWFTIPYTPCTAAQIAEERAIEAGEVLPRSDHDEEFNPEAVEASIVDGKPLILIAEDNDSNYKLAVHLLKDHYSIIRATNGIEAIELYKHRKPEVILMDINMPLMDGYEATKRIRSISHDIPIIALTAYAYESDRRRILNSGFNAYVSKPISAKSIRDAIIRVMGGVERDI